MPNEMDLFDRWVEQYKKALQYLDDTDDVTLMATLNLSPTLTDWDNSELKQSYFIERFSKYQSVKNISEVVSKPGYGTTAQKRDAIKLNYNQFIFIDTDIAFPEQSLKYQLEASYQLNGKYIILPQIVILWDDSWDLAVHKDFINKVAEVYDEYSSPDEADEALESAGLTANQMALVKALQKEDWWGFDYPHQAVAAALKEPDNFEHGEEVDRALKNFGNLYEVEINADKENDFLDWDKPFNEQSVNIQNKLKNINLEDRYEIGKSAGSLQYGFYSKENGYLDTDKPSFRTEEEAINFLKNPTGETLYSEIDYDPKKASNNLKTFGIKGIKYLDQDSRNIGEGTHNYVIFDPSIIKIVSKNGEFVMQSKTPENVEI
jgi:hypothetical protein